MPPDATDSPFYAKFPTARRFECRDLVERTSKVFLTNDEGGAARGEFKAEHQCSIFSIRLIAPSPEFEHDSVVITLVDNDDIVRLNGPLFCGEWFEIRIGMCLNKGEVFRFAAERPIQLVLRILQSIPR